MLYERANELYFQKKYDEAIFFYKRSLEEEPYNKLSSLFNLSTSYIKLKEFKKSINCLYEAIRLCLSQGENIPAKYFFNLAISYLRMGNNKKALIYFNTAWAIDEEEDCKKGISLILEGLLNENVNSISKSEAPIHTLKKISEVFIVIHRKNKGFEIVKYEIPQNNNQHITEKTLEFIECKRRNTKKFQRILKNIRKIYKTEKLVLL